MISASLYSVAVTAPGLVDWKTAQAVLRGDEPLMDQPMPPLKIEMLAANERRRVSPTIKLALYSAQEALRTSGLQGEDISAVFTSSNWDLDVTDRICSALTEADRPVSPTQFHNSVHNAPAGYWAIATGSHAPSSSISAGNASFSAGLLEAMNQVQVEQAIVMLVCYGSLPPFPLSQVEPITTPFAVALLLGPQQEGLTELTLQSMVYEQETTVMACAALERMRLANPAARSLPLLESLATRRLQRLLLPFVNGTHLAVDLGYVDQ